VVVLCTFFASCHIDALLVKDNCDLQTKPNRNCVGFLVVTITIIESVDSDITRLPLQ